MMEDQVFARSGGCRGRLGECGGRPRRGGRWGMRRGRKRGLARCRRYLDLGAAALGWRLWVLRFRKVESRSWNWGSTVCRAQRRCWMYCWWGWDLVSNPNFFVSFISLISLLQNPSNALLAIRHHSNQSNLLRALLAPHLRKPKPKHMRYTSLPQKIDPTQNAVPAVVDVDVAEDVRTLMDDGRRGDFDARERNNERVEGGVDGLRAHGDVFGSFGRGESTRGRSSRYKRRRSEVRCAGADW
ncbi:hypothetical protein K458DRAFT_99234 [Lentithecium fluviatile CBS 122367]|uniref:Uncharacterized protein n=1 Tax=Lentithecium fluviatile CBS 122367 TaxID=1168545 RepID=A0A6G1JHX1_9PLEO|nr:hypothetical protein K458DRAFT_99234 [Lentithecium fluviatile CBS 122367]